MLAGYMEVLEAPDSKEMIWREGDTMYYPGGVIDPNLEIDPHKDNAWKKRNILHLKGCKNCKYRYICGGGCASRMKADED